MLSEGVRAYCQFLARTNGNFFFLAMNFFRQKHKCGPGCPKDASYAVRSHARVGQVFGVGVQTE
jgi:hypothetical protein